MKQQIRINLELARIPSELIVYHINDVRKNFYPCEDLLTRCWAEDHCLVIEISTH